jgi:hypothetical protein
MTDNNKWLQRVVFKLNKLFLDGSDFDDRRWVFDWNDRLSSKENLDNVSDEDRALETLRQAKVLKARCDENWYRNQVLQAQEELEIAKSLNPNIPDWATNTVWGDWQTTDPAHREYDYLWYLDGFDYDRFKQFCETQGLDPNENPMPPQLAMKTEGTDGGHIAKLSLTQKTLKLNVDGVTYTLKRFDSTKRFNYYLAKFLFTRPDEWIKKDDLGTHFKTIRSKVKDWPKLMGFTGELKDIFVSVNTKEQTIMLNPRKSLTSDEAEIIERLVNNLKPK